MNLSYIGVSGNALPPEYMLTVITVCRNVREELPATVQSVLNQKAKGSISIEHLVVDGASTDGTPEWLAGQLAAGNIERYVSEPDRGIYDAMNKGINLARGQVLAFLNAGDTYRADADLAHCVLPICRGETESVAAVAKVVGATRKRPPFSPQYELMYVLTPCCHQAFFASSALYRKLGGYDSQTLRCAADTDLMYRAYGETGQPLLTDAVVADFQEGGFSANCYNEYRDEFIELLWRNWDGVKERCRADRQYLRLIMATLCNHCINLPGWQERHQREIPRQLEALQAMCAETAALTLNPRAKWALRWLSKRLVPQISCGSSLSRGMKLRLRLCQCFCHLPDNNRYAEKCPIAGGSLRACACGKIRNGLKRLVHHGQ